MTPKPKPNHTLPHGEGTFYYDTSRKVWRGVYDAGWSTEGKRRRITASSKNEDAAWQKFIAKKKEFLIHGAPAEGVLANQTVGGWCAEWLEQHKNSGVRHKTFQTDRSKIERHIAPSLGKVKLSDLTATHVTKLAADARRRGVSATTANQLQRTFTQIMRAAVAAGYRVPERVFAAKRVTPGKSKRRAMEVAQAKTLLQHTWREMPDHSRWDMALFQGVRQGEALGLTWDRVDLDKGEIEISWQLQSLPYLDRALGTFDVHPDLEVKHLVGSFHLTRPKTAAGERVIPLIPQMVTVLRDWKKVAPKNKWGLVWPRITGAKHFRGYPRNAKHDLAQWKDLQDAAKTVKDDSLPEGHADRYYIGHELRHTTISLLVAAGVPKHVIEQIVGQTELVESYVHIEVEQMREALLSLGMLAPQLDHAPGNP